MKPISCLFSTDVHETGLEEINGDLLREDLWTAPPAVGLGVAPGLAIHEYHCIKLDKVAGTELSCPCGPLGLWRSLVERTTREWANGAAERG